MKFYLLIFIYLCTHVEVSSQSSWKVSEQSYIYIHGDSNLHGFTCSLPSLIQCDVLTIHRDEGKWDIDGIVNINVNRFACENKLMTKEFMKTLQYKVHPIISIEFLDDLTTGISDSLKIANVMLHMVGQTHSYQVELSLNNDVRGRLQLCSRQPIKFSHFNLQPPSRLANLIKVHDELEVEFNLILEEVRK